MKSNGITDTKTYIETPGSRKLKRQQSILRALYNYFCDLGGFKSIILILSQDKEDENECR